ncbi:MAG: C-GCAxxG-C-C family protein [Eubacteriales bacterium]|jgi:C_GCAxxG_C_C family probable redox protein
MINSNSTLEEVGKKAALCFEQGYNCAQAVALSNAELMGCSTEGIKQIAAGFGYGLNSGCACGALAGGVMAIGMLLANPETKGFDKAIGEMSLELQKRFTDKFGSTCCRILRKKFSPLKNAHCKMITVTTAVITMELLMQSKKLLN